jgi:hypothetical protein
LIVLQSLAVKAFASSWVQKKKEIGHGGMVYVGVSSPPATEEAGAMGREIESRQDGCFEKIDIYIDTKFLNVVKRTHVHVPCRYVPCMCHVSSCNISYIFLATRITQYR